MALLREGILLIHELKRYKMMEPTTLQWNAYQQIFNYFNRELFSDQLPNVVLNFSRMKRTHGFFAPRRWKGNKEDIRAHEISLNPQGIARGPKEVLTTLVHEMVHLWQEEFGKPSRSGYHNKQWADKMEQVGLIPTDTGFIGGKRTGQHMTHCIKKGGRYEKAFEAMPGDYLLPFTAVEYQASRIQPPVEGKEDPAGPGTGGEGEEEPPKSPKQKIKYTCPACNINVWGKPALNINCNDCNQLLIAN